MDIHILSSTSEQHFCQNHKILMGTTPFPRQDIIDGNNLYGPLDVC